jgi:hypothetical protein
MGMPSKAELDEALAVAAWMREHREDPHHIAKALLNCHYQVQQLEHVLAAAEMFLQSGMAVTEHQKLIRAIEAARRSIERTGGIEHESFGLR